MVGVSLMGFVELRVTVVKAGQRDTWQSTALLQSLVARGVVRHDHDGDAARQTAFARVVSGDQGMLLSGKASRGPVEVLKVVSWAVWSLGQAEVVEPRPAIY